MLHAWIDRSVAAGANEKVDVRSMLSQGQGLLASATEQLGGADGLKATATQARDLLQSSGLMSAGVSADPSSTAGKLAAKLKEKEGKLSSAKVEVMALMGDVSTPGQAVALLRSDLQVQAQFKGVVLALVEDMICGVQLPTISGERDWGRYSISGLAVKGFGREPSLEFNVATRVRIEVTGLHLLFDNFNFEVDRSKTPKVHATGTLAASCQCWAFVEFEIVTDADSQLAVENLAADVVIDDLPITMVESSHAKVVRTLLKVFAKKGKETVQNEIRARVQTLIAVAKEKISAVVSQFGGGAKLKETMKERAAGAIGDEPPPSPAPPPPPPPPLLQPDPA
eukprot:SAG22_NODE_2944_length_2086_cov_0.956740_2_plen_338_part_01